MAEFRDTAPLTSFNKGKSASFSGEEKKRTMKHSGVFGFFDITRKNCQSNLVVVLVLKKVSITSHSTAFSIISLYYCMCFCLPQCGRVMYKETLWTRQYGFGLPRRKAAK